MRINSAAAMATFHAGETNDAAAQAEQPVVSATEQSNVGGNPFAVLGEPLFRVRADFRHDPKQVASAVSGPSESNPQQVAARHGIIVIGGSQDRAAASTPLDAARQGPMLQGIIIVGGSTPGHPLPALSNIVQQPLAASEDLAVVDRMGNFEIQRLMSAFNQAETLASNVQKKSDDTISGIQQKIG
jgi:hypothetical protein